MDPLWPHQRTILVVDIEESSRRSNQAKARMRDTMYTLLDEALATGGVTEDLREPFFDRGDGVITLVRPVDGLPSSHILDKVIRPFSDRLAEHNAGRHHSFRLRAAIHSGDVHFDERGMFGEDVDIAMRLNEAPEVKLRLRESSAPLVLVVSQNVYDSVVDDGGVDPRSFEPLVRLRVGDVHHRGWVQVPAEVVPAELRSVGALSAQSRE